MSELSTSMKLEIIKAEREQLLSERYHLEVKIRVSRVIKSDTKELENALVRCEMALDELATIEQELKTVPPVEVRHE